MGTKSRTTRSGQKHSGIGIERSARVSRASITTRSPLFVSSNRRQRGLLSPAPTSSKAPSRSGSSHKKKTSPVSPYTPRLRGSGLAFSKTSRASAVKAPKQPKTLPKDDETEILAEIVVSTRGRLDEVDEVASETMDKPDPDVAMYQHRTAPSDHAVTGTSTPPPPTIENEQVDRITPDTALQQAIDLDKTALMASVDETPTDSASHAKTEPTKSDETRTDKVTAALEKTSGKEDEAMIDAMDVDEEVSNSKEDKDLGPLRREQTPTLYNLDASRPRTITSTSPDSTSLAKPHSRGLSNAVGVTPPSRKSERRHTSPEAEPPDQGTTELSTFDDALTSSEAAEGSKLHQLSPLQPGSMDPHNGHSDLLCHRTSVLSDTPHNGGSIQNESLEEFSNSPLFGSTQSRQSFSTNSNSTQSSTSFPPTLTIKTEPTDHTADDLLQAHIQTHDDSEERPMDSSNMASKKDMDHRVQGNAIDDASDSELSDAVSIDEPSTDAIIITTTTTTTTSTTQPPLKPPSNTTLSNLIGESRQSFASSSSALTERSGLSSMPPSVSSKATTPLDVGSPHEPPVEYTPVPAFQARSMPRINFNVRPKVSVPTDLTAQEYATQCIEAAENSRLHPYALHQEEYQMLRFHISHAQVTTYLNIRNGILRLWVLNPQMAVTREEAVGCAKDSRWFDVANVCFDWLVRRGLINYGCVEIRQAKSSSQDDQSQKRKTIVVIGAGFSGLGCARQLDGLFRQYSKRFRNMDEEPPRIIVLEGRNRVGGRVYSRAFETLPDTAPGVFRGRRFTAEMGGMIITGFDRGNPLNILVRGQLGLPYHCLRSDMSLYDTHGTSVDGTRDQLVEQLFNACLDRVSEFKWKNPAPKLIEGNRDLIDDGRDSTAEGHKTIALAEESTAAHEQHAAPRVVNLVPVSTDRLTGRVHGEPGTPGSTTAASKAKSLGWTLKAGVTELADIDLKAAVDSPNASLGSIIDEALMQHKDILDLTAQDFRLLNWHIANLEYSNATNLNRLSTKGWDVDVGNEWDGKHTMVVGGYQSVARGLASLPEPLEIRHNAAVKRIKYSPDGSGLATITLEDGSTIEADHIVNTIPLGVLKHGNIEFEPALPSWKTDAIQRLGFGVLNKVLLVFKEAFWDKDRDIFGMLQTPTNRSSLNQKDYAARRGRFFQWFSVSNTTGMPCLLALMAGEAGYNTEVTPNDELVAEAIEVLRTRYGARVTQPLEAIVTRWESDRFARGSYSNAGVHMQPEDYPNMAKPLGNLHFAGEHTIITHPATVHGAYLSGLRAASEVMDCLLGPIQIPIPLVLPRETSASLKRKAQEDNRDPAEARLEAYETEISEHIHAKIGYAPMKPAKVAGNPYLLYNKAHYEDGRKRCEEGRRPGKGKPSPNEVRTMTSKMWREAAPAVRKPFEDQAAEQKRMYALAIDKWNTEMEQWNRRYTELRERYVAEHPSLPGREELAAMRGGGGGGGSNGGRRSKRVATYKEEDGSDLDA